MADYEKALATSKTYRRRSKVSAEEQLAADLEEFRREKEMLYPGEAGTFSDRDFRGAWKMGDVVNTPRVTIGDRVKREELGWKPSAKRTVDHQTAMVPEQQPSLSNMPGDQKRMMKIFKGLRSRLRFKGRR